MTLRNTIQSALSAARDLQAVMRGHVVLPGDTAYESARKVWNGAVNHHPALIAFCQTVADVQAAIRNARVHGLPLSVRGAGYDWTGRAVRSDGLVIDLSHMKQVEIDSEKKVATVAGGATAAAVIEAAAPHGLIAVTGWNSIVGMAGLILGGGYGPFVSKHGLALDNLVGAEIVLADGRHVTADAVENRDLFWALQGGGGNFGVVTSMRLRLHPLRELLAGTIVFPWSEAEAVLSGLAGALTPFTDDLSVVSGVFTGPDGNPILLLSPAWVGDLAQGKEIIGRLQRLGSPIFAQIGPMTCAAMIGSFDERAVDGRHYALQTRWVAELSPAAISALVMAGSNRTSPLSAIILQHFGGAGARVPAADTAFGLRREHFLVEIIAAWEPRAGEDEMGHRQWARALSEVLAPLALPGGYPNILGPGEWDQISHAYGRNLARLQDVKRRFDPDGIFSATPLPAG